MRKHDRTLPRSSLRPPTAGRFAAVLVFAVLALAVPTSALAQDGLNVSVAPDHARVSPGGSLQLTATVRNASGNEVGARLSWTVIPPRLGTVENGLFVATGTSGRGIVRVVAVAGDLRGSGHAVVDVGEGEGQRLLVEVSPARAAVDPLGQAAFSASVHDPATGDEVDAEISWTVVPSELGSIDRAGAFRAGSERGAGRVVARARAGAREGLGDAGVVVGPVAGQGARVSVLPEAVTVTPGQEVSFRARVTGASGGEVEADVEWSVMPERLGMIDTDGRFTAGDEELDGRVVAAVPTDDGLARGFGMVEIRRPGPGNVRVRIMPREAALAPGGDVQFSAEVTGPDGEILDVPVSWSVRPEWLGIVTGQGLLMASETFPEPADNGSYNGAVVASIQTDEGVVSDAARVRIREDVLPRRLRIYPQRAMVAPGETIEFDLLVTGAGDLENWTTEWAVFPEILGTITPDGAFTADPALGDPASSAFGPHEGVIAARATFPDGSFLTDLAHVGIKLPGQPVRVVVRPVLAVVPPGESQQFEAVVLGPEGQTYDLPVTWRVAPDYIGSVSPGGLFTASDLSIDTGGWRRPRGQVIAELTVGSGRVFRGAAVVVIDLPNPDIVVAVSPRSATLSPGESIQFTARVTDPSGDPLELPVTWTVSEQSAGTITPDGFFTAGQVPSGTTRRTQVVAWVSSEGRVYWDSATVRVSRQ